MTQYRFLESQVDIIEATDEYWDSKERKWLVVPSGFVGEKFYAFIPYRRAIPEDTPVFVTKAEPAVDPGEGYRLVVKEDVIRKGDQWWEDGVWRDNCCEGYNYFIDTPLRRRKMKKVVLKEYVERYGEHFRTEWHNGNVENCEGAGFIMPDESWPTGQEREIEIPA